MRCARSTPQASRAIFPPIGRSRVHTACGGRTGRPAERGVEMANVGGREVDNNDLGVMAAGAAALVFSFLPYWGVSYKGLGTGLSGSVTAWHGWAFLGLLMVLGGAG